MRGLPGILIVLTACAGAGAPTSSPTSEVTGAEPTTPVVEAAGASGCADVIDVEVVADGDGRYTVSATVSSADTGWEKYADLWTVTAGGTVVGERVLTHPHETEQPFTRSLSGVELPPDLAEIEVSARDSVAGFCGASFVAEVPR